MQVGRVGIIVALFALSACGGARNEPEDPDGFAEEEQPDEDASDAEGGSDPDDPLTEGDVE